MEEGVGSARSKGYVERGEHGLRRAQGARGTLSAGSMALSVLGKAKSVSAYCSAIDYLLSPAAWLVRAEGVWQSKEQGAERLARPLV